MDERGQALAAGGALGVVLLVVVLAFRSGMLGPVAAAPGPPVAPDGAAEASLPPAMDVADLYPLFGEPGRAMSAGRSVDLSVAKVGDLVLPSGRVVAADAFAVGTGVAPFTRTLPPGRLPVLVLRAGPPGGPGWVAAAMIRAGSGDPVRWEPALVPGQDPAKLGPDEFYGYGVDSGTGGFWSAEAGTLDEGAFRAFGDRLLDALGQTEEAYRDAAEVMIDPTSGLNVVAFSSGWGDGSYPTWFGLDAAGQPVVVLTSFDVLDEP